MRRHHRFGAPHLSGVSPTSLQRPAQGASQAAAGRVEIVSVTALERRAAANSKAIRRQGAMRSGGVVKLSRWVGIGLPVLFVILVVSCSDESPQLEPDEWDSMRPTESTVTIALPVLEIGGKAPAEVEAVLGPASSEEATQSRGKAYPKRIYRDGTVEVVFVDGLADWITFFPSEPLTFEPEVLRTLGLPEAKPDFYNPNTVIRWEAVAGLREISVFPGEGEKVHYVYILVRTKP